MQYYPVNKWINEEFHIAVNFGMLYPTKEKAAEAAKFAASYKDNYQITIVKAETIEEAQEKAKKICHED